MAYLKKEDQAISAKRHYLKNKDKVKSRAVEYKRIARKRNSEYVDIFFKNKSMCRL